jgi:hypothetical protein
MARIPIYDTPTERLDSPPAVRFGGTSPGNTALQLAAGGERFNDALYEHTQRQLDQANTTAILGAESAVKERYITQSQKWLGAKGVDAVGISQRAADWWDGAISAASDGLTTQQTRAFKLRIDSTRLSSLEAIARHETQQKSVATEDSARSAITLAGDMAEANAHDAANVTAQRDAAERALVALGLANGWSGERAAAEHATTLRDFDRRVFASQILTGDDATLRAYSTARPDDATAWRGLDVADAAKLQQAARNQLAQRAAESVLSIYNVEGAQSGAQALAKVSASELPLLVIDDVRGAVDAGLSRLRQQRKGEHAQDLQRIESALARGTAGDAERQRVAALFHNNTLSPAEFASMTARIDGQQTDRAGDGAAAAELQAALAGGLPIDPKSSEQRKALTALFAAHTAGEAPGSPAWQAAAQLLAQRTRLLPEPATAWIRQAVRSPDATTAAAGASFYGATMAAAPDALDGLDSDTRAQAAALSGMLEAGATPERAHETVRGMFDLRPGIAEQRKHDLPDVTKGNPAELQRFISQDFGAGLFHRDPTATVALRADFDRQTAAYFSRTGDTTLARQLAWSDLRRVYGPSTVNGTPQVLAFPPERFGVTPDEVHRDVAEFLAQHPQADGSTAEQVQLVPDSLTLRLAGDAMAGAAVRPSYLLIGKSGDPLTYGNGVRMRYTVPDAEALNQRLRDAEDAARKRAALAIANAKADRELARQRAARLAAGELR